MEEWKIQKCKSLGQEFHLQKFGLNYGRPKLFVSPECCHQILYLTWTLIWAIYHVFMTIIQIIVYYTSPNPASDPWPVYIKEQGYIVLATFSVSDCIASFYVYFKRPDLFQKDASVTPWYLKFVWVLYNTSNSICIYNTLNYYILEPAVFDAPNVIAYMMNTIYTTLNLILCAKPTQILHAYQPMIFALWYIIFTLIYHVFVGVPLHPALDWNAPDSAAIFAVVSVLIYIPTIHVFTFVMYKCRVCLSNINACRKTDQSDITRFSMY